MKSKIYWFLLIIFLPVFAAAQQSLYFTSTPTLKPDGSEVIFSYSGNLWRAATQGGMATQITSLQGISNWPSVSPDGKWIAFSNSQYGNMDVYVMPSSGGAIKRLTYHSAGDQVESWSWDSKWIYFTSSRYDRMSTYKVNVDGGTPVRVFSDDYFDYTHNAFENPVTGEIFFDDTWESANFYNRIGYKGAFNPDIQSYNPKTKQYKKYTTWRGKDMSATIDKNGKVYFVSDEANGQYNLYTFDGDKNVALTNFKTSAMHPFVNADGTDIVFEKDFQLYVYNIASKKSKLIPLQGYTNNPLVSERPFNVEKNVSDFDISPDGKKVAFVSRGSLFVSDVKGKFIRELNTQADERVVEVKWLKDNETLLFTQSNKGFKNLYTIKANDNAPQKQLSNEARNNRSISFNSDRSKAVYLSGNDQVCLLDLKTMQTSVLNTDEIWGLNSPTPTFSPDDQYLMYTGIRNFESDIILIRMSDKKVINITNTGVTEQDPVWSPDGKYIYFISDRTTPSYPFGLQSPRIYRMALEKLQAPFRSDRYDSLFVEKKKDTTLGKKDPEESEKVEKPEVKIDFANIMDRLERIGPAFGSQRGVLVMKDGDKTRILFLSNHENGKMGLFQLEEEPFEKSKTTAIKGIQGFVSGISINKKDAYVLASGDIFKLNLTANTSSKIEMDYSFTKNLRNEFTQMFYEAWAVLDENYYNVNFNKISWEGVKQRYVSYLPFVENRDNIRVLLNNMMGELNTSHYGFSTSGQDENTLYKTTTASTGIMFRNDNPYTVDYVVTDGNADYPAVKVKSGDVLTGVNGKSVNTAGNREAYFSFAQMPADMVLTFRRGEETFDVKIKPVSSGATNNLLYARWEDEMKQRVNRLSNNRIGYVHLRDMGNGSLTTFLNVMVSDSISAKEALILDMRYNTGGNIHDKVLEFLAQRPYLNWKYRNGKLSPQPNFAPAAKPIIVLVNEQTLSDGEMFSAGFQALKLGKVLGTETYRWIIFTSSARLIDGSTVRLPSWGVFTLDGKDLEKSGVVPDIHVDKTFMDRMEGNDPQIERAVQEILAGLK